MKPPVERIRLGERSRYNLITIKRRTKIESYNIICRWAFCLSLAEPSIPSPFTRPIDSNLEIAWKTFGGDFSDVFILALKQRLKEDKLPLDEETIATQFLLHLNRGIGYLAGNKDIQRIEDLIAFALTPPKWLKSAEPFSLPQ
jgi:DNA sulfur modification protein DndE